MIRLLFASDSFKGSLTSAETAALLTEAAREVFPGCECTGVPVADGGEGTVEAVISAIGGTVVQTEVSGPLNDPINASYGIFDGGRALIEMSAASGLVLIPKAKRDPMNTTTRGTGELILHALDSGCRDITVALGGSATNDGGMGCMRALGVRFLTADGKELSGCGRDLISVAHIDCTGADKRLSECRFTVMCDVNNPLCGENGAAYTFARQKGADEKVVKALETGMQNYRGVILREFGVDCDAIPGAGAAGGLGAALTVFCGAKLRSGIETVLDMLCFDSLLDGVDLVVTGEGRADSQSCRGKVMQGVGMRAKAKGIPVVGLCGSLGDGAIQLFDCGVDSLMTAVGAPMTLDSAIGNAPALYREAAVRMFRLIRVGMRFGQRK